MADVFQLLKKQEKKRFSLKNPNNSGIDS